MEDSKQSGVRQSSLHQSGELWPAAPIRTGTPVPDTFPRNSQHSFGDWRMGSKDHHNMLVAGGVCTEIRVFIRCFDDLYKPDLACLCLDLTSARMFPSNSNHLISTRYIDRDIY